MAVRSIGQVRGIAIYLSAILGTGLLVLPSLAYQTAGPASVLAWLALLVLSVAVALVFAHLGTTLPDATGVGAYSSAAFGARAGAATTWWFILALPFGAPATAMIAATYAQHALGLPDAAQPWVAAALLVIGFACAMAGVRVSGAIQVGLVAGLLVVLVAGILGSSPRFDAQRMLPFAPHGWASIPAAAGILFFSFAGWEAVAPMTRLFARKRDVRAVSIWTLSIIGVLYVSLSLATILALGRALTTTSTPVEALLAPVAGVLAAPITGLIAVALAIGAMTSYLTGGGHMAAGLARDRWLPRFFAQDVDARHTPRRAIAVLGIASLAVLAAAVTMRVSLADLMTLASAMFIAVTAIGLAAATRLIAHPFGRVASGAATVVLLVVLAGCGWAVLFPVAVTAAVLLVPRRPGRPGPGTRHAVPRGTARSTQLGPATRSAPGAGRADCERDRPASPSDPPVA